MASPDWFRQPIEIWDGALEKLFLWAEEMLKHFAVGPNEDQTYAVAYLVAGTKVAAIVMEHMSEATAIAEAARLNTLQREHEKQIQRDLELLERRRIM